MSLVGRLSFNAKKKSPFTFQLMIWNWDIDNKSESPTNISGIQAFNDDEQPLDNSILVTQKMDSHFEDFERVDFATSK